MLVSVLYTQRSIVLNIQAYTSKRRKLVYRYFLHPKQGGKVLKVAAVRNQWAFVDLLMHEQVAEGFVYAMAGRSTCMSVCLLGV